MEKYRGYTISYDPPPIPDRRWDWQWSSENFDAEQESDGTWHSNGLCGQSASLEQAKADIDEQIAEIEDERNEALIAATRKLVFAARTTGGVAGHDADLCAALDEVEALLPPLVRS